MTTDTPDDSFGTADFRCSNQCVLRAGQRLRLRTEAQKRHECSCSVDTSCSEESERTHSLWCGGGGDVFADPHRVSVRVPALHSSASQ